MNFEIAAETYVRLAGVTKQFPEKVDQTERNLLRTVRLEHLNGSTYAVASNRKIAAIYFLGKTTEPDGVAHLHVDVSLIKQCETEKPFNSVVHVTAVEQLGIVSAKTTMGFSLGSAGYCPKKHPLNDWRNWIPQTPVLTSKGAMAWNLAHMLAINAASPSGLLAFPEWIDADQPVIVRDLKSDNFMALFMPNLSEDDGRVYTATPAKLPEWW